jgi:hypothetical protein
MAGADQRAGYRLAPVPDQHREQSMQMILQAADAVSPGRAIVLGAGRCDEIPLAALAEQFTEVELVDVDGDLLRAGLDVANLPDQDRAKVRTNAQDLVGVTAAAIADCETVLLQGGGFDDVVEGIAAIISAAEPRAPVPCSYDLVVASCVLSQLTFGLIQDVRARLARGFPESAARLQSDPRLTQAFDRLTRRCEAAFVDYLTASVAAAGRIYFSDTVQMCFVRGTEQGDWTTPGTWRMTKSQRLDDYLDERFAVHVRRRWNWVVNRPVTPGDEGRLYDVQAMILSTTMSRPG